MPSKGKMSQKMAVITVLPLFVEKLQTCHTYKIYAKNRWIDVAFKNQTPNLPLHNH